MRISRIAVHNCKGFSDLSTTVGDVVLVSGQNGSGKSSLLDIISAAFVTDGSRSLLKTGTEEGHILVVLEDEGETIEVRRTLKPGEVSKPSIKSSKIGPIPAYAKFIKELIDTATMDPLRKVMTASPAEQAKILLETLPLELDQKEVESACEGVELDGLVPVLVNARRLQPLDAIKAVESFVYEQRKGINRDSKKDRACASQLRANMGPSAEGGWKEKADSLSEQLRDLSIQENQRSLESQTLYAQARERIQDERQDEFSEIDHEINAKIAALEQERNRRKQSCLGDVHESLDAAEKAHEQVISAVNAEIRPERERLTAEHAVAQQHASQQERATQTLQIAAAADKDAEVAEAKAKALTDSLEALDGIRLKLLEKLPIRGLKIEAGQAYLNEVPLQEVNTAERAKFWIRVAVMRAMKKDLAVVLVDDADHFDSANFKILTEACKKSGLQFFISKVEDHELRIETVR